MILKITCFGERSGITITYINNKLDYEVKVVFVESENTYDEKVKIQFGIPSDHVGKLTTTNHKLGIIALM